jgi:hypothetical protein
MIATEPSSLPLPLPPPPPHGDELPPLPARVLWRELVAGWVVAFAAFAALWLG